MSGQRGSAASGLRTQVRETPSPFSTPRVQRIERRVTDIQPRVPDFVLEIHLAFCDCVKL
jgi:hypothetical protein